MKFIKKVSSFVAGALLLSLSTLGHAEPITSNEYNAVVETAYNYFNGLANGDQALLEKSFDFEFGHVKILTVDKDTGKDSVKTIPLDEFAALFNKKTTETWEAKILSVDIVDDKMAIVKLDFDKPTKHYVDYLVMYKRNSEWRIINKTFVANDK